MTPPARTDRADWMGDLLARRGYLVSGHPSTARRIDAPSDTVGVLRHFRISTAAVPDAVILTVEHSPDSNPPDLGVISSSDGVRALKTLFPSLDVLVFSSSGATMQVQMAGVGTMDDDGLRGWFGALNPQYVLGLGGVKRVNRSSNDAFADWTRLNLTAQCVINDVDALKRKSDAGPGVLVELKRPKSDVRTWGPYRNDRANYESCAAIAGMCGLENRTIAYNRTNEDVVRVHVDVRWSTDDGGLVSSYALMTPEDAIATPLASRPPLLKHISKN